MRLAEQERKRTAPREQGTTSDPAPSARTLLAWYRRHRRRLPWRAEPGETADPYRVWLSEIMLQQTTVKAVVPYYAKFLARFPTLKHLARAKQHDVLKLWAGLGYYARARNLHACAQAVMKNHGGAFPDTEEGLRSLPGIGAYTAAAIAAIAFGRKTTPIDGNIERVIARLHAVDTPLPAAKAEIRAHAERLTPAKGAGDFAQAMMDLGATICTPKNPACSLCPWNGACRACARGDMETYPRKIPKANGTLRRGAAFVALREDGAILLRSRPATGLLGGMTEVPTTQWSNDFDPRTASADAPFPAARWQRLPGHVTHVFTHFPLELTVFRTVVPSGTKAPRGARWSEKQKVAGEALPNVMRKVIAHAVGDQTAVSSRLSHTRSAES
jgi:A/G-specific adenine glycosylase